MKKSIPVFAGVLLTLSTALPLFSATTVYADGSDDHGDEDTQVQAQVQSQDNQNLNSILAQLQQELNNGRDKQEKDKKDGKGKHHDKDNQDSEDNSTGNTTSNSNNSGNVTITTGNATTTDSNTTTNTTNTTNTTSTTSTTTTTPTTSATASHDAMVAALHAELATFHQDIIADHAAHDSLVTAARDYVVAMRDAMAIGDTATITTGTLQAQQILASLKLALSAQAQVDEHAKALKDSEDRGDLTEALAALKVADAREQAKTAAMESAATALEKLSASIEAAVQTGGTASGTSNSTGNTTTSSTTSTNSTTGNTTTN